MLLTIAKFLPTLWWTILSGMFWLSGDLLFRQYLVTKFAYGFELSFFLVVLGTFCVFMSFFQQNIAIASVAAVVFNVVGYIIASYFLFNDVLRPLQLAGIGLGITSFVLLELS